MSDLWQEIPDFFTSAAAAVPAPNTFFSFAPEETHMLWHIFFSICAIPHGSGHEEALRNSIVHFAQNAGWLTAIDTVGNLRLDIPGRGSGLNSTTGILLQAHLDMVLKASDGRSFDELLSHPVQPKLIMHSSGTLRVTASETTLGADNGIGVAAALAVAGDPLLADCPPLRILLTVNEERGLIGARALTEEFVTGQSTVNYTYCLGLDVGDVQELRYGSAGAQTIYAAWPYTPTTIPDAYIPMQICLKGFSGGHSGLSIHRTHANPLSAAAYLTHDLFAYPDIAGNVYLHSIAGGSNRNSIPTDATIILLVPTDCKNALEAYITGHQYITCLKDNLEPVLKVTLTELDIPLRPALSPMIARNLLQALRALPHGVLAWYRTDDERRVPGTSLNIARVQTTEESLLLTLLPRSFHSEILSKTTLELTETLNGYGATVTTDASTPGWIGIRDSEFARIIQSAATPVLHAELDPVIRHSGQEAGILARFFPPGNIFGIGPTIRNHHEPSEYVEVDATTAFYRILKNTLLTCA